MTILTYYTEKELRDDGGYEETEHELEALPCPNPACESDNLEFVKIPHIYCWQPHIYYWQVTCNDCNMRGPDADDYAAAVKFWNTLKR